MNAIEELKRLADPKRANILAGFFKTGKGEYGEGDVFLGITVPQVREVAKNNATIDFDSVENLIRSKIHEHRLCGLLVLVNKYEKADTKTKKEVVDFYLTNTEWVNNWDLVDLTAHKIIGDYLADKDRGLIYQLARSKNLWERRIAIISTFHFIRNNEFGDGLKVSEILLNDEHELIHKAVGWMLREIGKRNLRLAEEFLNKNYRKMPRVTLRYAIERFESEKKDFYMRK